MKGRAMGVTWLATFAAVVAMNIVFHGFLVRNLMNQGIEDWVRPVQQVHFKAILVVELVFSAGIVFFGVHANAKKNRIRNGAIAGAYLGLLEAVSRHFINYAVLIKWPLTAAFIDIGWHLVLGAAAGMICVAVYDKQVKES